MASKFEENQPDLSKLKTTLLTSAIQQENNPLYQTILGIIEGLQKILKLINGNITDLQTKTAIKFDIKQTEIDFGTTPVADGTFTVVDPDVKTNSNLIAAISYEAPTGKDLDEIEMDMIGIVCAPGNKQFIMFIRSVDGSYLHDKFKVNYLIG